MVHQLPTSFDRCRVAVVVVVVAVVFAVVDDDDDDGVLDLAVAIVGLLLERYCAV